MARPRLTRPVYRLHQRGKRWYVFYTKDGQLIRETTGCESREEADAWLASYIQSIEALKEPESKTVSTILDGYLQDRKPIVSDYRRLEEIRKNLDARMGWIAISELKTSSSKRYIDQRHDEGVSDGTIRRELGMLRAALNWATEEEWIDKAPTIRLPPKPGARDRWLTDVEVERLYDAAEMMPHLKLFLQISLNTASRKGAILELQWRQVDLKRRLINFNPAGRRQTSKHRQPVKINDTLAEALARAARARTCDFVIEWNGDRVISIRKAFDAACARARIKGATPHTLRHTVATKLAMAGEPMEKIQRLLGHQDLSTTVRIYAHWHPEWLKSTVDALG